MIRRSKAVRWLVGRNKSTSTTPVVVVPPVDPAVFSVMDYGATGNGSTDDTAAIQLAINAAEAYSTTNGAATVYFPEGNYAVAVQDYFPNDISVYAYVFWPKASNVTYKGDGPGKSAIFYHYFNLTDPEKYWEVKGNGNDTWRILRGSLFNLTHPTIGNNVTGLRWEGLRLCGNCDVGLTPTSGGHNYACSSASSVITSNNHGMANGARLRFGNTAPDPLKDWDPAFAGTSALGTEKQYYVVNAAQNTFQVSDTVGGSPVTFSDESGFYATDGSGWDWTHKAIYVGNTGTFSVHNCTIDRWRGECIYGGGGLVGKFTITNSTIERCNASAVSIGHMDMADCTVRYVRNGIEDFAEGASQKIIVRRTGFVGSNSTISIDEGGVVPICHEDTSGHIIEDCTFDGFTSAITIVDGGSNMTIQRNVITNCRRGITITPLFQYDVGDRTFNDITISSNSFTGNASIPSTSVILNNLGGNWPMHDFLIADNVILGAWQDFINDANSVATLANKTGYVVTGNDFSGATTAAYRVVHNPTYTGARPLWYANTPPSGDYYGNLVEAFDSWWDGTTPISMSPSNDRTKVRYTQSTYSQLLLTLSENLLPYLPDGFTFTAYNINAKPCVILANGAWNTFATDVSIGQNQSATMELVDGKFNLVS